MKRFFSLLILFLSFSLLNAQQKQITKFAVVDTQKIYSTFKQTSTLSRDYEEKKNRYQSEIQDLSEEIIELKKRRVQAQKSRDTFEVASLTEEINAKTSFLQEFSKEKNDELNSMKEKLNDNKFYASLYDVIKKIAIKEGYSMVLSLQDGGAILWYSPTVDITQDIIKELKKI